MNIGTKTGFLAPCYHYMRPPKTEDRFPRIIGNQIGDFIDQVKILSRHYNVVSPEEVMSFYYSADRVLEAKKKGILFTFDDGLSDHYVVAKILYEFGIKALFFIPSCILADQLPANPTILHYCLAEYGISIFLNYFMEAASLYKINTTTPVFRKGDNVWEAITKIKQILYYELTPNDSRKILLYIYRNSFLRDYGNALEIMHLTKRQIEDMLTMGHSIATHSHSHFVSTKLSDLELEKEVIAPRSILEKMLGVEINIFGYPFGEMRDLPKEEQRLIIAQNYKLIFTGESRINNSETSPFNLGRYEVKSRDTKENICTKLDEID